MSISTEGAGVQRTEAEWQARERELLEANNRYLQEARDARSLVQKGVVAVEDLMGQLSSPHPANPAQVTDAGIKAAQKVLERRIYEEGGVIGEQVTSMVQEMLTAAIGACPQGVGRERLIEHLRSEFSDSYDCIRVWDAWSVGTMGEDDFEPITNRLEEIADGILTFLSSISASPVHQFTGDGPGCVGADNCQLCGRWFNEPETATCKNRLHSTPPSGGR